MPDTFDFKRLQSPGEYLLVNTDEYWFARDGQQYKAFWGNCRIRKADEIFGFKPTGGSTNWYLQVGDGDGAMFLAGCRIHYAQVCLDRPTATSIYCLDQ
jgi:hypothetical protein